MRISDWGQRNKPNSARQAGGPGPGERKHAKRTQFGPAGTRTGAPKGETCETNPICAGATRRTSTVHKKSYVEFRLPGASAKRSQFLDCGPRSQPGVTTLRIGTNLRRDACPAACRLGPHGPVVQTKPIPREPGFTKPCRAGWDAHSCETNPIWPSWPMGRVPGRRKRAKRTQFGQAGRQAGSPEGETCKTKPIRARGAGAAMAATPLGGEPRGFGIAKMGIVAIMTRFPGWRVDRRTDGSIGGNSPGRRPVLMKEWQQHG